MTASRFTKQGAKLPLAMRLALRDALQNKWRSALIVVLIMLPVLAIVSSVTWHVSEIATSRELAQAILGDEVAARVHRGHMSCIQDPVEEDMCFPGTSEVKLLDRKEIAPLENLLGDKYRIYWLKKVKLNWEFPVSREYFNQDLVTYSGIALQPPLASAFQILEGELPRGDEIAIDRSVAKGTGAAIGMSFKLSGKDYRISAIVGSENLYNPTIFLSPETPMPVMEVTKETDTGTEELAYLVGPPLLWEDLIKLNKKGWVGRSRAVLDNLSEEIEIGGYEYILIRRAIVISGIGIVAITAICGTAFMIAAKSQRRMAGLIIVAGAEVGFIRKVMAWHGLLLGGIGSCLGGVLGVPLGWGISVFLDSCYSSIHWGRHVDVKLTVLVFILGVLAALFAALIPAWGLRKMDALAAVRTAVVPSSKVKFPIPGLVSILLGLGLLVAPRFIVYLTGYEMERDHLSRVPLLCVSVIVIGALLLAAGMLLAVRWILQLLAKTRVPVPLRLAFRDSSRNQGRAISVVAATMAATVLAALGMIAQATELDSQRGINRSIGAVPNNVIEVKIDKKWKDIPADIDAAKLAEAINKYAQVAGIEKFRLTDSDVFTPVDNRCSKLFSDPNYHSDWRCYNRDVARYINPIVIAEVEQLPFLLGREPSQAEKTIFDSGQGLALVKEMEISGKCYLDKREERTSSLSEKEVAGSEFTVPCLLLHTSSLSEKEVAGSEFTVPCLLVENNRNYNYASFVISSKGAKDNGIVEVEDIRAAIILENDLTWEKSQEVLSVISREIPGGYLTHARFFSPLERISEWITTALAIGLVLLVAAVTTALWIVDSRSDEATFAAIGAETRFRKQMAASQIFTTTTMGVVLGAAITVVVSLASIGATTLLMGSSQTKIPLLQLLVLVVATPVVGAITAWLVTPARLTMVRRLD